MRVLDEIWDGIECVSKGYLLSFDCNNSQSMPFYLLCLSELFWLCCVAALKCLPVFSYNALINPVLIYCLQSLFSLPVPC